MKRQAPRLSRPGRPDAARMADLTAQAVGNAMSWSLLPVATLRERVDPDLTKVLGAGMRPDAVTAWKVLPGIALGAAHGVRLSDTGVSDDAVTGAAATFVRHADWVLPPVARSLGINASALRADLAQALQLRPAERVQSVRLVFAGLTGASGVVSSPAAAPTVQDYARRFAVQPRMLVLGAH